jgi:ubiquinone/menaquinone biosynthesis C-methylase UbiE
MQDRGVSRPDLTPPVVPAEAYDDAYYRSACGGHEEWSASGGAAGAPVYSVTLDKSGFEAGMVLLDIGTGRGEMLAVAVEKGAALALGVEYSSAGTALAMQTLRARGATANAQVLQADARLLPLPDASVDMVTMLDVIEHLGPAELDAALREAHRVLRPGGWLVAHTFPTSTIYDVTYATLRRAVPRWRRDWPADPRNDYERLMHVNEQSLRGLRSSLRRAGFEGADVRHGEWLYTDFVPSARARGLYAALARRRLTRGLAIANLWVHAQRSMPSGRSSSGPK